MLPTFIIGLREGLEAALIVGIVAAILAQQGRRDALRKVWIGTVAAVVLCVAIGVVLDAVSRELPQRQQEGLETVIGFIAVAMVTYMVFWMRTHARGMKHELEEHAASALATGSARALVLMAFLAVMREGFETAVFLLATFQHSTNPAAGGIGALLGIACAVFIGWLIFKGGLKINMGRFFLVTGVVLVVIAAGLVMSSLRTAHEAGWVTFGQSQPLDLTWLVRPGTPVSSLVTGVLGIQQKPAVVEIVGYLAYLVPMLLVLLASRSGRTSPTRRGRDIHADAEPPAAPIQPSPSNLQTTRSSS
jgi:high-affinity iron transporter